MTTMQAAQHIGRAAATGGFRLRAAPVKPSFAIQRAVIRVLPASTHAFGGHGQARGVSRSHGQLKGVSAKQEGLGAPVSAGSFTTIEQEHKFTLEVKKSKFVTTAWPVQSSSEAMELIKTHGDPEASHNCFAYKIGAEYRSSDDGEPGGTAGRPMLSALEGEGLDYVCVMVTRYYGGTKLGAGGLVRAYGGAARECLRSAPRKEVTAQSQFRFEAPFQLIGSCHVILDKHQAVRLQEDYTQDGVVVTARVEASQLESLAKGLMDASSGAINLQIVA